MNVKTLDRLVALLLAGITVVGVYSWWQATQQARGMGGVMGQMMGAEPGVNPAWYLFGMIVAVSAVLGVYLLGRPRLDSVPPSRPDARAADNPDVTGQSPSVSGRPAETPASIPSKSQLDGPHATLLRILPEDEQRVIQPILESPGLTQVELRGRSGFSKAKVSQTVSELEDRGLIYRERQGRTYRVYPGELLKDRD